MELLDVSQCSPVTGAAAFDRSRCALKRRGSLMTTLPSSSSSTPSPQGRRNRGRQRRHEWREGRRTIRVLTGGVKVETSGRRRSRHAEEELTFASIIPSTTEVGIGMLHAAAALGDAEAAVALGHRYEKGLGVERSAEVAAFYYAAAAGVSHEQFHRSGRQPSWEMNRLQDGEEDAESAGQTGDDDERLRRLVAQAEDELHVPSMNQLAGLLYWGHRGFARDQARARRLWNEVAEEGFQRAGAAAENPAGAFVPPRVKAPQSTEDAI